MAYFFRSSVYQVKMKTKMAIQESSPQFVKPVVRLPRRASVYQSATSTSPAMTRARRRTSIYQKEALLSGLISSTVVEKPEPAPRNSKKTSALPVPAPRTRNTQTVKRLNSKPSKNPQPRKRSPSKSPKTRTQIKAKSPGRSPKDVQPKVKPQPKSATSSDTKKSSKTETQLQAKKESQILKATKKPSSGTNTSKGVEIEETVAKTTRSRSRSPQKPVQVSQTPQKVTRIQEMTPLQRKTPQRSMRNSVTPAAKNTNADVFTTPAVSMVTVKSAALSVQSTPADLKPSQNDVFKTPANGKTPALQDITQSERRVTRSITAKFETPRVSPKKRAIVEEEDDEVAKKVMRLANGSSQNQVSEADDRSGSLPWWRGWCSIL